MGIDVADWKAGNRVRSSHGKILDHEDQHSMCSNTDRIEHQVQELLAL